MYPLGHLGLGTENDSRRHNADGKNPKKCEHSCACNRVGDLSVYYRGPLSLWEKLVTCKDLWQYCQQFYYLLYTVKSA